MSPSYGSFNYGRGESSQRAKKVEDSQQNNPNPPRGSGFQRGRGYNVGRGKSSQGVEKIKDSQQNNPNPPHGSGFQRDRGYNVGRGRPIICFKCGEEGHLSFECPNYNMQEAKQGENPRLNLAHAEDEE